MGKKKIPEDAITLLLTGNEHRGNDASGIAFAQANGEVNVFKADDPAWRFVTSKSYAEFIEKNLRDDTWAVILHARGASQGSPRKNENNHPMYMGKSAIVHNGQIHNDHTLFTSRKYPKSAETDSDIIRAFVDEFGITEKCIEELNVLSGSAAGAAIHPEFPRKLLLFRSGSPMILGSNEDFFAWSSEKNTLHKAMRPWVVRFKMYFQQQKPDMGFAPMADDTAWIIGEEGLEFHGKFKALCGSYVEPFRKTYENYGERQKRWDEDAKRNLNIVRSTENGSHNHNRKKRDQFDDAYCPDCKMEWIIPKGGIPKDFTCNKERGGCGKTLIAKPFVTIN